MGVSWQYDTDYAVTFKRAIQAEDGTPLDKTPYVLKFRTTPVPGAIKVEHGLQQ
jgi:hypothetical protein